MALTPIIFIRYISVIFGCFLNIIKLLYHLKFSNERRTSLKSKAIIFTLLISFCIVACNQQSTENESLEKNEATSTTTENTESQKKGEVVVATVNDSKILKSDLNPNQEDSLERAILNEVLYHAAIKEGVDKEFEEKFETYKKNLLASHMTSKFVNSFEPKKLDEYDVEKHYNDNISNYTILQLGVIAADTEELANEIHKGMIEGNTFVESKKKYKDNKNVRFRVKKENLKSKHSKNIEARKGFISNVIAENDKFKIYKVLNLKKIEFKRVKNAIRSSLLSQEKHQALLNYSDELKKKHNISVEINK